MIFIFMVTHITGSIPLNGKVIARNIANGLESVDPSNKSFYETNLQTFYNKIDAKMKEWQAKMAPSKAQKSLPIIMSGFILKQGLVYKSLILWNRNLAFRPLHLNW